jgi:predicted amidophosphoribosyltransferase
MSHSVEGETLCDTCANELDVTLCTGCDKEFKGKDLTARGDVLYCEDCLPEEIVLETKEEAKDE